jgi:hypothetical protein
MLPLYQNCTKKLHHNLHSVTFRKQKEDSVMMSASTRKETVLQEPHIWFLWEDSNHITQTIVQMSLALHENKQERIDGKHTIYPRKTANWQIT